MNRVISPSRHRMIVVAAAFLLMPLLTAQQNTAIALRGGKVMTITKGTIENGVVVMEGNKITAVGKVGDVALPKGARVIDVKGMTVYPGLIDSESNLGLTEITLDPATNDLVESSDPITPHMHVSDAFHAETELIPEARINGVTNAIVAPTKRNTLPGQSSLIQLDGRSRDHMLLVTDIALPLNFTGAQRRNEGSFDGRKFPSTRMGVAAQLRQAMIDAQDYQRRWDEYEKRKAEREKDASLKEKERPKRDLKLEALVPYLEGKRPVVLAAEEGSDLKTALALAAEFKLKVVLNQIVHSQALLDEIAALKVPVIVGPIYREPKPDERYDIVYRLPGELSKRGIKFAFASYDAHDVRRLPHAAGYSVAFGLPYEEAMKALTIYPAEIWGVADRLGSLEPGKTANVVVSNGDPLDVKTDVKHVFIAGREIPMESRQTHLRDQYMK